MPKDSSKKRSSLGKRHDPLHVQISRDQDAANDALPVTARPPKAKFAKREQKREVSEDFLSEKMSRKILKQARQQQEEVEEEENRSQPRNKATTAPKSIGNVSLSFEEADDDLDEEYEDVEETEEVDEDVYESFASQMELSQSDEAALSMFMGKGATAKRTLADMIMQKIQEKEAGYEAEKQVQAVSGDRAMPSGLNPKVIEVYTSIGELLSRYRSGKLPKAFKIIPSLNNWEEILYITDPYSWSPHAVYQATRIFVSNLNSKLAHRFFNLVLLDRVREDIRANKKLNYHLYMALKKALYKPAAFFKGILLPLCEAGNCTLREAVILGSVLAKVSIPSIHSSAALLKIAEMDYNGANSIFMRILIDKKYALPYQVVDAVVFHFLRFKTDKRSLPVLWHQCLLIFIQRYKEDVSAEQKEALLELLKAHYHPSITADIRREIVNSKCRGDTVMSASAMETDDQDGLEQDEDDEDDDMDL